jgi:6-phosphofructokinase
MVQERTKVFLSYPRANVRDYNERLALEEAFVHRVSYFLRKQTDLDVFCYDIEGGDSLWTFHVRPHLTNSEYFILFLGPSLHGDSGQLKELETWRQEQKSDRHLVVVKLRPDEVEYPEVKAIARLLDPIVVDVAPRKNLAELHDAGKCAKKIYCRLHAKKAEDFWMDDLPIGYPFGYEKEVIRAFVDEIKNSDKLHRLRSPALLASGTLVKWPSLEDDDERRICRYHSPLNEGEFGSYRDGCFVVADPRSEFHTPDEGCLGNFGLGFPEAGPRRKVALPVVGSQEITIGIVVSGGIAPGINAVLEGIVERHKQYSREAKLISQGNRVFKGNDPKLPVVPPHQLKIRVFENGLIGMDERRVATYIVFEDDEMVEGKRKQAEEWRKFRDRLKMAKAEGGSVVSTSRHDDLLEGKPDRREKIGRIVNRLTSDKNFKVDILYVIGGEGSMRAAHVLAHEAKVKKKALSVVGVPKTMDNDILWVWQSFGFLSAVEKAREFFSQIETEVRSNPRLCIMQLFGSDSGFVVSHTALAGGASCLAALIPEIHFSLRRLASYLYDQFENRDHGILVLSETAMPVDVEDHIDDLGIGLDDEEKSAVRLFVGSPMLRRGEVAPDAWGQLISTLVGKTKDLHPGTTAGMFCRDDKEFLEKVKNEKNLAKVEDQIRVVSIVNKLMIENCDSWMHQRSTVGTLELFGDPVKKALRIVDSALRSNGRLNEKGMKHLEALDAVMSLPYEAHATIREFARLWRGPGKVVVPEYLFRQLKIRLKQTHARLVAETILMIPQKRWTDHSQRRVFGQTPDALRTAGLKIISRYLEQEIQPKRANNQSPITKDEKFWQKYRHRVFASEPRHLIRAIGPSCHDVIFCDRMGRLAVDGAMSGYRDFMISQWLTEFVLVPLPLVVLGRKRVPADGIFWKSVIASTKQPENLWY